jgi:hypothetical protein
VFGLRRLNEFVALGSSNWFWTGTPVFPFRSADEATAFVRERLSDRDHWNTQVVSTLSSPLAFGV